MLYLTHRPYVSSSFAIIASLSFSNLLPNFYIHIALVFDSFYPSIIHQESVVTPLVRNFPGPLKALVTFIMIISDQSVSFVFYIFFSLLIGTLLYSFLFTKS